MCSKQVRSRGFKELREQLDRSNSSLKDMRQGSITEASELEDQLTCCKDMIAEQKAVGSAYILQLDREVNMCYYILGDCQIEKIACDIAGSRQLVDSDDAVERLKVASSHEKYQLAEEVHRLKERRRDDEAANTMPSSVLQTEVQRLNMLRHFPMCPSHVHLQSKQGKVEQLEKGEPAPSYGVPRLRERARAIDRRLARQIVGLFLLDCGCFMVVDKYQERIAVVKLRDVRHDVKSVCKSFLVMLSVVEGCRLE